MKIGDGPAAVIGDKHRKMPLSVLRWEGAVSRIIRESENLPEQKDILRKKGLLPILPRDF